LASVQVGDQAPDFTLTDENNEKVTLSEQRGSPVVLVFYPFDFSPPCTKENCEIRDEYGSWLERGAKVYGISRDSRFVHAAWKKQENFRHSLLADTKGEAARAYGVWNEMANAAERATFVIDREGKVVYSIHNGIPDVRDHSAVAALLG
jgi:mycoredoxin-dependent peroxiredoxin